MRFLRRVAQAFEQVPHATLGVGHGELLLHPCTYLLSRLEAMGIEFGLQCGELLRTQARLRAADVPRAQTVQTSCVKAVEPVMYGMLAGMQNTGGFAIGVALRFEQDAVQTIPQPHVGFVFVATQEFGALLLGQR